ncbi:HAMP domain-containing histidine kinase [Rhizobiaceae bacterium BDR2-2]|uniref:histidine kinase n=1 Tax=Ectorhizobium quercum TaxID=2965071 RepID=A0AAE3ST69_9HYPH|nr:HAMP domain-containing sensor histidine kinase [Ectorhizobium quercum]MCX8995840.1 HAMP domain-containing histidine kinase [Ectorhizobium quercum]
MDQKAEAEHGQRAIERLPGFFRGLSGRLLALTVVFVMLAEVLIFVPSIASMRLRWLQDHLAIAAAAGVVIDGLQAELPPSVQADTLLATGARAIVLRKDGTSRLIAVSEDMPGEVDGHYDVGHTALVATVSDAFDTLLFGGSRLIRAYGTLGDTDMVVELVMPDEPLRRAMLVYARNVFAISLVISLITAGLIYVSINRMMIRPVRRLTNSMSDFSADPSDPARIMVPDTGGDELTIAGQHLAAMQTELQRTLKQQKNLADLGLAVSKINHDMRNILASAQLISDRLVDVDDPMVRNFAPKLLRTIDRAVGYTNEVLSYGQTTEAEPKRRRLPLAALAREVRDMLGLDAAGGIEFVIAIDPGLEVDADSEQLFRVINNLCRNAHQALASMIPGDPSLPRRITVSAERRGTVVAISVDDTGPGMPDKARENLFRPFRGGVRSGGTGLGLVIARELVLAHGGTIALVEKSTPGTEFRIEIPDRPVSLHDYRQRRS